MLRFEEKDSGQNVEIPLGNEFEVYLPENPTAGYRWSVVQNGLPVCTLIEQKFLPGLETTGQPGTQAWKFQCTALGAATLELVYRRSWEEATSSGASFVLHLTGTANL